MAGGCLALPEAVAPAQNCAGASADGARPDGDVRAAAHPKTTDRDPMAAPPSAAPLNGPDPSSAPDPAVAQAIPEPPAQTVNAERW